jgi:16S rRNA (guanine527-N7)-methyltransferase
MPGVEEIGELLLPYSGQRLSSEALGLFQSYLALITKWNTKFNLTAIRDPEQIVTRHFGEGVFAAQFVPEGAQTLMDLGSGVGIPGIPLQIMHPKLAVTLVEAQQKKASFLREAVRLLGLSSSVRAERAEQIPTRFDVVALRAVEKMDEVLPVASRCVTDGGSLLVLTTKDVQRNGFNCGLGFTWREFTLPAGARSVLRVGVRADVPRGTRTA